MSKPESVQQPYEPAGSNLSTAEQVEAGFFPTPEDRLKLSFDDPRVAIAYLRLYGGGQKERCGVTTIPDGHISRVAARLEQLERESPNPVDPSTH